MLYTSNKILTVKSLIFEMAIKTELRGITQLNWLWCIQLFASGHFAEILAVNGEEDRNRATCSLHFYVRLIGATNRHFIFHGHRYESWERSRSLGSSRRWTSSRLAPCQALQEPLLLRWSSGACFPAFNGGNECPFVHAGPHSELIHCKVMNKRNSQLLKGNCGICCMLTDRQIDT